MMIRLRITKQYKYIRCVALMLIFGFSACADRDRDNPFDPAGKLNITLDVISEGRSVILSWSVPAIEDIQGYNLYRLQESVDTAFVLYEPSLPPDINSYTDTAIEYQKRYSYYITAIGIGIETNPSQEVSVVPGPGFVWIVDKWGYQILKTTYDLESALLRYFTNFPPEDMDVLSSTKRGGIVYPSIGIVEIIDLEEGSLIFESAEINYPYRIASDSSAQDFWVIDSSGSLYNIDPTTQSISLLSNLPQKPVNLTIDRSFINVVDQGRQEILRFNRSGQLIETIQQVENQPLVSPQFFVADDITQKQWLSDQHESKDFIYVKHRGQEFVRIDSLDDVGDIALNRLDGGLWYINRSGSNSTVVQLSADGKRQIELLGFWSPFDIHINRYDKTLLVVNTGLGRVEHYNSQFQLIGISPLLNVPVKAIVE